jgi:hypothetical protein
MNFPDWFQRNLQLAFSDGTTRQRFALLDLSKPTFRCQAEDASIFDAPVIRTAPFA